MRPSKSIADNYDDRGAHSDAGDLFLCQPIEVKHRQKLDFTSKEDYPYKTVIIDDKKTHDSKDPKPYCYVIVNKDKTHAALVMMDSKEYWFYEEYESTYYQDNKKLIYYVDVKYVNFVKLTGGN